MVLEYLDTEVIALGIHGDQHIHRFAGVGGYIQDILGFEGVAEDCVALADGSNQRPVNACWSLVTDRGSLWKSRLNVGQRGFSGADLNSRGIDCS